MGLLEHLVASLVHLVVIGIDVVGFFLVVRLLVIRWPKRLLLALDRVGKPVVQLLVGAVIRVSPVRQMNPYRRREMLCLSVLLLGVAGIHLVVGAILG